MRLDDGGPASMREQPGQQHARLYLRAGDRQLVANRPDGRPGFDDEGRVTVLRLHLSAHLGEWLGDPPEGSARERLVADEFEPPLLPDEQPGQEPHHRAGVPAVDWDTWGLKPAEAHPAHAHCLPFHLDLHPERAHPGGGRERVGGSAEAREEALPVRNGAEQERAVGDRLVAGHGEVAAKGDGRLHVQRHAYSSSKAGDTITE
jgi:hypothetical protein